jgi:hypothetical protein
MRLYTAISYTQRRNKNWSIILQASLLREWYEA